MILSTHNVRKIRVAADKHGSFYIMCKEGLNHVLPYARGKHTTVFSGYLFERPYLIYDYLLLCWSKTLYCIVLPTYFDIT